MRIKLIIIVMAMLAAGCMASHDSKNGLEGDSAETIEMSGIEAELLAANYSGPDRILKGRLFGYQKEALMEMRAGMAYMEKKYPGYDFEYIAFTPSSQFGETARMALKDGLAVHIYPDKSGYACKDTYFEAVLQDKYNDALAAAIGQPVKSRTSFPVPQGEEIGPATTIGELNAIRPPITRNTHLFIEENERGMPDLAAILQSNGFFGSYVVYYVPADQLGGMPIDELEAKRAQYESDAFNLFR